MIRLFRKKYLMKCRIAEDRVSELGSLIRYLQTSSTAQNVEVLMGLGDGIAQRKMIRSGKANAEQQMQYWQAEEQKHAAELARSDIEQVKKAKQERDRLDKALKAEKLKLENAVQAMVEAFNSRPFSFFGMPVIRQSLELLEDVKETTECVPGMDQDAIDYLLARKVCICGTHLLPGTLPFEKVMEERRKLPPEAIGSVVMNYKNKAEGYLAGTESFLSVLEERYKQIRIIQRTIGDLQDQWDAQSELILDDTDASAIEAKRKNAATKYREAKADFEAAVQSIGRCKENIKNCEATIEKFAKSSKKNQRIAKLIAYSEAVYEWLNETYREKEETVRTELQKRVNDNFSRMYHGERSISIDDKYRVHYADVKTEESDGLKAVKSFAFIASLVSMAKDKILDDQDMQLGQVYPIVMDAPFSNVDEIHINNICQILPNTANQGIMAVMKKDWDYAASNLGRYVGMSYMISKDTDADGNEIETSTHIVPSEM